MASKQSTYQKNLERYMKEYGEVLLPGLVHGLTEEDLRRLDQEIQKKLKELAKNQDGKQSRRRSAPQSHED